MNGQREFVGWICERFSTVALFALFSIAALAVLAAPRTGAQTAAQNVPAGDAQNGKAAFAKSNCVGCHGADGQGTTAAPQIGPPGRAFSDFVQYVRKPSGRMPAVSAQTATDSDLADIYLFLRSMGPESSISAAAGDPVKGKRIYVSYGCYECHGFEGQGSTQTGATRIGPPALSVSVFAGYIRRPTGQMPPYIAKVVSDSDVADIYAFLKTIPMPPSAKGNPLLNQ